MRLLLRFAVATVCLLLLASCSKRVSEFRRVELTKADIVSLFHVRLSEKQVDKFEWTFAREHEVCAMVEESSDTGKTWRNFFTSQRVAPVSRIQFIYRLEPLHSTPEAPRYELTLWLSHQDGASTFVGSSACIFSLPPGNIQTESHFNNPECILIVTSGKQAYRVRLVAKEKT